MQDPAYSERIAPHAIVLASGLASRLGLLSDDGKWSVRFKAAPILATQLGVLSRAGVRSVTVTCRPEHHRAVQQLADVATTSFDLSVLVVPQSDAPGPGMALAKALGLAPPAHPVVLLLADTVISSIPALGGQSWIGTAAPPAPRRWCEVRANDRGEVTALLDHLVHDVSTCQVAVGIYYFHDRAILDVVASNLRSLAGSSTEPVELSSVLDEYRSRNVLSTRPADGWIDLGDSGSITDVSRSQHRVRSTNHIHVSDLGVLRKRGTDSDFAAEAAFMRNLPADYSVLFPRVLDVAPDDSEYSIEYLDYRTLAEYYLYRPGTQESWASVADELLRQLRDTLWSAPLEAECDVTARCRAVYLEKLTSRFDAWWQRGVRCDANELEVNGRALTAGTKAMRLMRSLLEPLCINPLPATVHGDLNFSNILHAPAMGIYRLLDPRGAFGGPGPSGDARYDAAKLRHSYNGMYDALIHGLFSLDAEGPDAFHLRIGPNRDVAKHSIDSSLRRSGFELLEVRTIEASLFLSMLPLHDDDPDRQWALYAYGLQLLAEVSESESNAMGTNHVVG